MTEISLSISSKKISFPSDFDQAAERVHNLIDADQNGFLDYGEVESSKSMELSQGSTDQKIRNLLLSSDNRIADLSNDELGSETKGVSLADLKKIPSQNRKSVEILPLLSQLEIVFAENDVHFPANTAKFLSDNYSTFDPQNLRTISEESLVPLLSSPDKKTADLAKLLKDHFNEIAGMDHYSVGGISRDDVNRFRAVLDPANGYTYNYGRARYAEKQAAGAYGILSGLSALGTVACLVDGQRGKAILAGALALGTGLIARSAYNGGSLGSKFTHIRYGQTRSSDEIVHDQNLMVNPLRSWKFFSE